MAFQETQKIDQLWIKILYGVSAGTGLAIAGEQMVDSGNQSEIYFLIPFFLFLLAIYAFLFSTHAKTRIDSNGIHYQYWPFIWNMQTISWNEIEKVVIRTINPVREYGGWGYRMSPKGRGIVLAKEALIISIKNKKDFVISTKEAKLMRKEIERQHPDLLNHG